jgi:NADH-quinone oxidoreductase subunit A
MELSPFGTVLLFLVGGLAFLSVTLLAGKLLRPNRPNDQKSTTYENGEDPVGSAWGRFNPRYYIIALIFILFEVELVFLFPWAIVFGNAEWVGATDGAWAWLAIAEMFIFILMLALGLAWVWAKGYLEWIRPLPVAGDFKGKVPMKKYKEFNRKA